VVGRRPEQPQQATAAAAKTPGDERHGERQDAVESGDMHAGHEHRYRAIGFVPALSHCAPSVRQHAPLRVFVCMDSPVPGAVSGGARGLCRGRPPRDANRCARTRPVRSHRSSIVRRTFRHRDLARTASASRGRRRPSSQACSPRAGILKNNTFPGRLLTSMHRAGPDVAALNVQCSGCGMQGK
jgi:hypothetical protein